MINKSNKKVSLSVFLQKNQDKLIKSLNNQTKEIGNLLKILVECGDPESFQKDQMSFLSAIAPRILNEKQFEKARQGIAIDELMKICNHNMELAEKAAALKNSLPQGHVLRLIYAEHELVLYFIFNLEKFNLAIQKANCREESDKLIHGIIGAINGLCSLDHHHYREEQVICPQLEAHGCGEIAREIFAEHRNLRKGRIELKKLADLIDVLDFNHWKTRLDTVVNSFVPAVRQHIYKEENILYPNAVEEIKNPIL